MSPVYFLIGLHIGERLAPTVRPLIEQHGKEIVYQAYWNTNSFISQRLARLNYRRWVRSLP